MRPRDLDRLRWLAAAPIALALLLSGAGPASAPCANVPPLPTKDRVWWDVFPIPSGTQVTVTAPDKKQTTYNVPGHFKMRSRFVDYAGYYVLHCHILAHEDRGMMTVVQVAPRVSPYSHE